MEGLTINWTCAEVRESESMGQLYIALGWEEDGGSFLLALKELEETGWWHCLRSSLRHWRGDGGRMIKRSIAKG